MFKKSCLLAILIFVVFCFQNTECLRVVKTVPSEVPEIVHAELIKNNNTFLIDVRTNAEIRWVGYPLIEQEDPEPSRIIHVEYLHWTQEKGLYPNPEFLDEALKKLYNQPNFDRETSTIFTICCCGGRSVKSATDFINAGYKAVNTFYGFDGDYNDNHQRGLVNGWKVSKLPWRWE